MSIANTLCTPSDKVVILVINWGIFFFFFFFFFFSFFAHNLYCGFSLELSMWGNPDKTHNVCNSAEINGMSSEARGLVKEDHFCYFSINTHVVGTHLKHLSEALLMSTQKLEKIIREFSLTSPPLQVLCLKLFNLVILCIPEYNFVIFILVKA